MNPQIPVSSIQTQLYINHQNHTTKTSDSKSPKSVVKAIFSQHSFLSSHIRNNKDKYRMKTPIEHPQTKSDRCKNFIFFSNLVSIRHQFPYFSRSSQLLRNWQMINFRFTNFLSSRYNNIHIKQSSKHQRQSSKNQIIKSDIPIIIHSLTTITTKTHKNKLRQSKDQILIEKVHYQLTLTNIIVSPMQKEKFPKELKFSNSIITCLNCLHSLFSVQSNPNLRL